MSDFDIIIPMVVPYPYYFTLMVIYMLGALGNILSIGVFNRPGFRDTPAALSHQYLCLMETLYMVISSTGVTASRWNVILGMNECLLFNYGINVVTLLCNWTLVIITCERLTSVAMPHRVKYLWTRRRLLALLVALTVLTGGLGCSIFIADVKLDDTGDSNATKIVCYSHFVNNDLELFWHWLELFATHFLPTFFLVLGNGSLICWMRRKRNSWGNGWASATGGRLSDLALKDNITKSHSRFRTSLSLPRDGITFPPVVKLGGNKDSASSLVENDRTVCISECREKAQKDDASLTLPTDDQLGNKYVEKEENSSTAARHTNESHQNVPPLRSNLASNAISTKSDNRPSELAIAILETDNSQDRTGVILPARAGYDCALLGWEESRDHKDCAMPINGEFSSKDQDCQCSAIALDQTHCCRHSLMESLLDFPETCVLESAFTVIPITDNLMSNANENPENNLTYVMDNTGHDLDTKSLDNRVLYEGLSQSDQPLSTVGQKNTPNIKKGDISAGANIFSLTNDISTYAGFLTPIQAHLPDMTQCSLGESGGITRTPVTTDSGGQDNYREFPCQPREQVDAVSEERKRQSLVTISDCGSEGNAHDTSDQAEIFMVERNARYISHTARPSADLACSTSSKWFRKHNLLSRWLSNISSGSLMRQTRRQQQERHMTITLLLINFAFLATKIPYDIHRMTLPGFPSKDQLLSINDTAVKIHLAILASLYNAINFLLYCVAGSKFREELKQMLGSIKHKLKRCLRCEKTGRF